MEESGRLFGSGVGVDGGSLAGAICAVFRVTAKLRVLSVPVVVETDPAGLRLGFARAG